MEHRIHDSLIDERIRVRLVGCGGNGSQMLTGLARLDHALRACRHRGLDVVAQDPDTVSPANVGRQLFAPGDVGRNKSVVLVHRVNAFFGLDWSAEPTEFKFTEKSWTHLIVSCVDTRRARSWIHRCLTTSGGRHTPPYWMDLGNRADDGQVVLGCPASSQRFARQKGRLPTVAELFPEIIRGGREDNTPSCSLAEALERQHLFVNQAVVTPALQILWTLFRFGKIDWHGAFVNLKTGRTTPLPVDPQTWARMKGQ
jgi:PRTRC genetic system ThiF family protein